MKLIKFSCLYNCYKIIRRLFIKSQVLLYFVLVTVTMVTGCQLSSMEGSDISSISYYTEIPGISEDEIQDIENLKTIYKSFTYGSLYGTELFVQSDGSYEGFTQRFCEFLTNLFGIPFETVLFDNWDILKSEYDAMEIDFVGTLTNTPERMEIYQMSSPIAERALRIFTLRGFKDIKKEVDVENLKIGFLSETITASYIKKVYPITFDVVDVENYATAANMILSGEIDAFVDEEEADTFFLDYKEIESKKFFSMVYSPVSMSSANKEFASIISVIDKYLDYGGVNSLLEIYNEGGYEYAKYKLDRLLTDEEKAYLESTNTNPVKLALENDNYPVSFYNESSKMYQGIAIDILDEIKKISNIQFEVVTNETMSWTNILELLETGKASMLTQLLYTDTRKGHFLWSEMPYCTSNYAILSTLNYPDISNFQVSWASVGVLKNSAHEYVFYEWFSDYTKAKQYESQNDGVEALKSGEIDLLMASEFIHLSQTNYREDSGLKINILLSTPMESYFGFNKNEELLSNIINKIMSNIDTYSIERSWTSRNFDYQKKAATEQMKYLAVFSAMLFVILMMTIFLFIKNKRISKELSEVVAKRTFELESQTVTLETIYESIPDILFTVDKNLVYTSCNCHFEDFVGRPRAEVIGKKASEILREKKAVDFFSKSNQEVIDSAKMVIVEESVVYPDGTPEIFETIKKPLFQNGELVGMLGIARNITERKSADERTKIMLNTTPLACNLVDRNFNLIDTNEEAANLFGLKDKQEYIERFWEIFPKYQPDGQLSQDKANEMISKAFREGRAVFEWMHQKPDDNTPIPAELTLVHTRYGKADVITGYIRDLREQKKMLNEIEHKDHLLQTVNNAAAILLQSEIVEFEDNLRQCMSMLADSVKVDRVYIWKNYTKEGKLYCAQIYEWSENAEKQQGKDITLEASYEETAPGWEETLSGGQCINNLVRNLSPEEQESLSPQGILSILIVPVFIRDTFWGFVGFDDCHCERLFSEDEITVLRSGGIMIASALLRNEMTLDIQNAVAAAQEASRAKSNFLSNMSHEIRTPLNAITGMTRIGKSARDIRKKDYAFDKIEEASIHLLGVVNDILDMSKIEANKLELSDLPFDFEKMIQKVVSVVNVRMYEKNQNFKVYIDSNIPYSLIGDSQRLSQVITNLLSNAMKFTQEKENIRLDVHMLNEENGICTIQINVTDTGIGVDPKRQPYIFDPFEQSDNNTARKFGGTGLGLSISKRIVQLMDGEIWLDSELGKGSTFSFTVKIRRDVKERKPTIDTVYDDIRILAIDEDLETRKYIENMSVQLGAFCDTVKSGEDALQLIEEGKQYDLFFVDWNISDMDSLVLSNKIKEYSQNKSVIIMISALDWSKIEEDAAGAGVDNFIPKPLFPSVLADCINDCLGQQNTMNNENNMNKSFSFHGKKLLLAEDVEINREIVLSLLEDTGIEIDCAENGIEVLEMFKKDPKGYDLIFMDIQMPEMDGLEATKQIRSLGFEKAENIPIVAMTANVFKEDIEQCLQVGMNDHLGKPLDIDELLDKIKMYLYRNK